ncbi:MAG: hypothetical protein MH252_19810 [Thermosynechococcaceae cyanobacterium MS004]|nr:hypothetical protein [Thermosynechococcaceae cyanobacterium MS004]
MADFTPSPVLHSALQNSSEPLNGAMSGPMNGPAILACPLPLSLVPPEELLPELGHELKTPLAGIMGLSQVMQRQAGLGDRSVQYAGLIHQKSQQLLIAINDLLDLTQLCTHQFVLQLQSVEFYSAFKTALQVAQRISGQTIAININSGSIDSGKNDQASDASAQIPSPSQSPTGTADSWLPPHLEHWVVADQSRVEQLFIHLLGYLFLQSSPQSSSQSSLGRTLTVDISPWGHWSCFKIKMTPLALSDHELISLGWSGQPLGADASAVPYRSSAVLKFLLARRLAHLQGAELTWRSDKPAGQTTHATEVAVWFPRDLTHTTPLSRSSVKAPLWLAIAQCSEVFQELFQVLQGHDAQLLMARSLPEAQEKIQFLSPTVILIHSEFAEAYGLNVIQNWLMQQRFITSNTAASNPAASNPAPLHPMAPILEKQPMLLWVGAVPFSGQLTGPDPIPSWPMPLSLDTCPALVNPQQSGQPSPPADPRVEVRAEICSEVAYAAPSARSQSPASHRPLTLLQLDSAAIADTPSPRTLDLITQLVQRYGCSMLAIDDAHQAELLIRIWQPDAILCPGTLPEWAMQVSKSSLLTTLPIFLLQETVNLPPSTLLHYIPYAPPQPLPESAFAAVSLSPDLVDHFYQQLLSATSRLSQLP